MFGLHSSFNSELCLFYSVSSQQEDSTMQEEGSTMNSDPAD